MTATSPDKVTEDGDPKELPTLLEGGQLVDHRDGRDVVLRLRGVRTQFGRASCRERVSKQV